HMDAEIGRLFEALEARGLAKKTIVFFCSDHGLAIGSHGLLGKQNLYEHSMRAPLVIAGPGVPSGKKSGALGYLFDLFPTACDLCGVKPPDGLDSRSLVPVMTGKKEKVREVVFGAYRQFQRSVRTDRWKLIRYPHINHTQLFDLQADPDETNDLAGDPKHADTVKELTKLLEAQQTLHGDKQPLSTNTPDPMQIERKK